MACSPGWKPRSTRAWPSRFRFSTISAHDHTRSPSISAGLSGWRAAWAARMSIARYVARRPAEHHPEHGHPSVATIAGRDARMSSSTSTPTIAVDRPAALVDEPVTIELSGFPPREPVTITGTLRFAPSAVWRSYATFVADQNGRVDLSRQAPVAGTYDGVAPMGLVWSAERDPGPWVVIPLMEPWFVDLEATGSGGAQARATL